MVPESIRSAWISALGQHQGSSSGRTHRQTPVSAAEASQDRRTRETSKTLLAPRWRLPWCMASLGSVLLSRDCGPRTSSSSLRRGAERARDRYPDAAHMAAFGHDSRSQRRELGADCRCTATHGPALSEVAPASPERGGARFNPLAEVRLRTPYEIRDVQNIAQLFWTRMASGFPDHWLRAGVEGFDRRSSSPSSMKDRDPTLGGIATRLSDPAQPINQTLEHIMTRRP